MMIFGTRCHTTGYPRIRCPTAPEDFKTTKCPLFFNLSSTSHFQSLGPSSNPGWMATQPPPRVPLDYGYNAGHRDRNMSHLRGNDRNHLYGCRMLYKLSFGSTVRSVTDEISPHIASTLIRTLSRLGSCVSIQYSIFVNNLVFS